MQLVSVEHLPPLSDGPQFIGPIASHAVVLHGRRVPLLSAHPLAGGRVLLCLDDRFSVELTVQEADQVVPFLAHGIAVAMGYSSFPAADQDPQPRQVMPRMQELSLS